MSKPRILGYNKPYLPNRRADMRRVKLYRRKREYTDRHKEVVAAKREERMLREKEERYDLR